MKTTDSTNRPVFALSALGLAMTFALLSSAQAQPTRAAMTRDIDRATSQPVNGVNTCTSIFNHYVKCKLYTVPAGKRLVVETVSYQVTFDATQFLYSLAFGTDDTSTQYLRISAPNVFVVAPGPPTVFGGNKYYSASQSLRFYIDEGQVLAAGMEHGPSNTNYSHIFAFSGYLVDK